MYFWGVCGRVSGDVRCVSVVVVGGCARCVFLGVVVCARGLCGVLSCWVLGVLLYIGSKQ